MPAPSATPATIEALRGSGLARMAVGGFAIDPHKSSELDERVTIRSARLRAASGSFARHLKDTLVAELSAAGLYDPSSSIVVEGVLIENQIESGIAGTGTGRLASRFTIHRLGVLAFQKELSVDARWETSLMGAVAVPAAINEYEAMYKKLVALLLTDQEFRLAVAR
jgi:hypothetical protein